VAEGEVGEVVVTSLNPDYPLIRFATGDMSAVMPGQSPCGRTNMRIKGWMGRADQTTKIKGMFVRPEQVADLVKKTGADRARVIADRDGDADKMIVQLEGEVDEAVAARTVQDVLKLKGDIHCFAPGKLPRDGLVIEDRRTYET
jgi:phenylacetate-CoA ligase